MVLEIFYTTKFKKDFKRMKKRNKDLQKLKIVIQNLVNQEVLPLKYCDHSLVGNYVDHRECHIEPDWILIYKIVEQQLRLERTGSHSDLFR